MKDQITSQQVDSYRSTGFLVIENFLDHAELSHWRQNVDEAVAQRLASHGPLSNQAQDDYYSRVFTQCLKLGESHDGMRQIMHDPRLGRLAGELAGVNGIRIWHDQALIKPPFGNPTSWHLDNPYWSFSSKQSISIWVALDDATYQNGCMFYIPGTHLTAGDDNATIGPDMAALFKLYPQWTKIDPVGCPCPAGSAVFHNGLTAHGAGANMTNKPRRAMTCAYLPDGSTFNGKRNILPEEYFNILKIGDVLNDNTVNPLIWSSWMKRAI